MALYLHTPLAPSLVWTGVADYHGGPPSVKEMRSMSSAHVPDGLIVAGDWYGGPASLDQAIQRFIGWSGIYLIASRHPSGGRWIDVGESRDIGNRLRWHDRKACWIANATGPLGVFVHVELNPVLRLSKEYRARVVLRPPCGDR